MDNHARVANEPTVLFSGSGTKGDIFPLISIALELSDRGFRVILLTNDYHRELVESNGVRFLSTGNKKDYIEVHGDSRIWNPKFDVLEIGFEPLLKKTFSLSYDLTIEQFNRTKNLAVVGTFPLFNGATMAADALGIPHITLTLAPRYVPSLVEPPAPLRWIVPRWIPRSLGKRFSAGIVWIADRQAARKAYFRRLNEMRRSRNAKPIKIPLMKFAFPQHHLQIALFPGWFGMRASDWPTNLYAAGFPEFSQVDQDAQAIADKFILTYGSPLVFTTGTGVQDATKLFSEGKKICENLDLPGLFVGKVDNRSEYGMEGFLHLDYVDFKYVLPRCLAIVHHGGIGTLAQAVRAAIPQLVRPLTFDQFDNADRVHRLGLGTFVMPKHFHGKKVTPIIRRLISHRKTNSFIDKYAALANHDRAIPRACDLIEKFLSGHKAPFRTLGV